MKKVTKGVFYSTSENKVFTIQTEDIYNFMQGFHYYKNVLLTQLIFSGSSKGSDIT